MCKIILFFSSVALSAQIFAAEAPKDFPVYQTHYVSSSVGSQSVVVVVNINTADISTLIQLKGVGIKKAEAIVDWRKRYGPFKSVEDLIKVKGIGQVILDANRAKLKISD